MYVCRSITGVRLSKHGNVVRLAKNLGTPVKMVRTIEICTDKTVYEVKFNQHTSDESKLGSDRETALSSVLFAPETFIMKTQNKCEGLNVGRYRRTLACANDIIILRDG